ncbi:type I-C CRISPR-associated protein Cas7/Csd2 [Streptomyces profundus]|uniref:type I-C CRISPR-associated protein Cas7/Csd2 n=1 Tax=Streptomyces profundus TaxID=2867410 RepID=UPI001D16771B|nr:type I-C CRISPR-associated protein Cas7/Csd2 [Streptomyces sp. MA3_2.13]UED86709.1 type I-C CRISPR-associated protein Cas7/Csd2 [Streptomyces sp. MA3_2.13]
MTDPHLDPQRKHDFVLLIEALDSNPNGDPDNGGLPRTDVVTGQGLITDVAIKRKIRNTVALFNSEERRPGYEIYVEAGTALNAQHERAYVEGGATAKDSAQRWMCQNFFDVRMFGAVMTTGKRERRAGRVQGPVQLGFARSIDPVTPLDIGITRVTPTREEDLAAWNNPRPEGESGKDKGKKEVNAKETEMGSKHIVPYGLYRGSGHFSAPLAAKTGVTSDDLAMFWRALTLMFEHDRAAARTGLTLRALHVFSHDDAFGRVPAHTLTDLVTATLRGTTPARSITDYDLSDPATAALPNGVVLTTLVQPAATPVRPTIPAPA